MSNISSWNDTFNFAQQLRVSSLSTRTIYSLTNSSILFSEPILSSLQSFNYAAADVFQILDMAFNNVTTVSPIDHSHIDEVDPNNCNNTSINDICPITSGQALNNIDPGSVEQAVNGSIAESLLNMLVIEIDTNSADSGISSGGLFSNLIILPLYTFNIGTITPNITNWAYPEKFLTTAYFAKPIYRLIISNYSLYIFTILAYGTMIWCAAVLWHCWKQQGLSPNLSHFPEIDFATKYATNMPSILQRLGNAGTRDIENQITKKFIFVGAARDNDEMAPRIVFSTDGNVKNLISRREYT